MSRREPDGEVQLLHAFRRAAAEFSWYRTLLDEHDVTASDVVDAASFSRRCPILTKRNTFDRFPIDQLAATSDLSDLASVMTSSGHGGRFSFGLTTRSQAAASGSAIDRALDAAFDINSRSTLAINCLPMGVGFASDRMTIATTSVREDMAVALVDALGTSYDQIVLVADPLFMKRLIDHAAVRGTDWRRYKVQVVLGEEIFGEHFRNYVAACLGHDVNSPERGYIASSFGAGELGLHLCYETQATIALRRSAAADSDLAREVLNVRSHDGTIPMIFAFDPLRTFIEIADASPTGYGRLTITMLDSTLPIPLLRFQTGDIARLLDADAVADVVRRRGTAIPAALPARMLALEGRDRDALPNGSHIGVYKDSLYADHSLARCLTGAFRVIFDDAETCTMHVQLAASSGDVQPSAQGMLNAMPAAMQPARVVFWPEDRFPFGKTIDYERKFAYYVPGESDVPGRPTP